MAEGKRTKKRKVRQRRERRFLPERLEAPRVVVLIGMAGALVLGAGVYAQWIRETPLDYAPYLVAVGAIALGLALWFSDSAAVPIRVGDAGVAAERGNEISRILWCDIETISCDEKKLTVNAPEQSLSLSFTAHPTAAAWVLREAARRVPDALDVKRSVVDQLPKPKESDGERVPITAFQVTGRECRASKKTISFERDARLCPNCAEVYLKDQVPKKCLTCNHDLLDRAYRPAS